MSKVEESVCDAVNIIFSAFRPDLVANVTPKELYAGKTSISLARASARGFAFYVMHDHYALAYSLLAKRSKMNIRSVIRQVKHIRERIFIDALYKELYSQIKTRLEDGIL